jgi:hypothetical protein
LGECAACLSHIRNLEARRETLRLEREVVLLMSEIKSDLGKAKT